MSQWAVLATLFAVAGGFALYGFLASRRHGGSLEDWVVARGSLGKASGVSTLLASSLGAWILFGPAEAATWGGLAAVIGYSIGVAAPRIVFIPLGRRMRALMPEGHSLTEYVWHRFGRGVYVLALMTMLFYMFIFLTAEITGIALIVSLMGDVPLWLTALVVVTTTLAYTSYGGLRASILTDALQMVLILPLVLVVLILGWQAVGGAAPVIERLSEDAPQLLDLGHVGGLEFGATLIIALLVTGLFHQGYWQRVFAARDDATLKASFLIAALASIPFVFAMGLFGLAFVAYAPDGAASTAVFAVLFDLLPYWIGLLLLVLGLALVMSSADTVINAVASIVAVDLHRALPQADATALRRFARMALVALAVPVVLVASQGYSVLYLFLLADLICAALVFPIFFGMFAGWYSPRVAGLSIVAGLVGGASLFPDPAFTRGHLLGSFLMALLLPAAVSLVLWRWRSVFDFKTLKTAVRRIET